MILQVNDRFFALLSLALAYCKDPFSGLGQSPKDRGEKQGEENCGKHVELHKAFFPLFI